MVKYMKLAANKKSVRTKQRQDVQRETNQTIMVLRNSVDLVLHNIFVGPCWAHDPQ